MIRRNCLSENVGEGETKGRRMKTRTTFVGDSHSCVSENDNGQIEYSEVEAHGQIIGVKSVIKQKRMND